MNRLEHSGSLSQKPRDYLLLLVFVLVQHRYLDRALTLVDALVALGEEGEDILFYQVVIKFLQGDFSGALMGLEDLDTIQVYDAGTRRRSEMDRFQNYIRARCYCQTGRRLEGEAIARSVSQEISDVSWIDAAPVVV